MPFVEIIAGLESVKGGNAIDPSAGHGGGRQRQLASLLFTQSPRLCMVTLIVSSGADVNRQETGANRPNEWHSSVLKMARYRSLFFEI